MKVEKPESAAKAALLTTLKASKQLSRSAVISELVVGRQANRADLVLVSKKLSCFEIKTKADTLRRLSSQVEAFSNCFDEITVVAATNHVDAVRTSIPDYVGLMELVGSPSAPTIITHRRPTGSPTMSVQALLNLLPVHDLREALKEKGLPKRRSELMQIALALSVKDARAVVVSFLRERYQSTSRAFSGAVGKTVRREDLSHLQRIQRFHTPYASQLNTKDWEIFQFIGSSFGRPPPEVIEAFSQT